MVYNIRYSEVNNSVIENSCGRKTEKVLWTKDFSDGAQCFSQLSGGDLLPIKSETTIVTDHSLDPRSSVC